MTFLTVSSFKVLAIVVMVQQRRENKRLGFRVLEAVLEEKNCVNLKFMKAKSGSGRVGIKPPGPSRNIDKAKYFIFSNDIYIYIYFSI